MAGDVGDNSHKLEKKQVMKFSLGRDTVTLQGNPNLGRSLISLKTMVKTADVPKTAFRTYDGH